MDVNLEQLLEHREFLTALARGLVADPLEQEELLWETMSEGATNPPRHAAVRPWLARVMRNRATDRRRVKLRRLAHERACARSEQVESAAALAAKFEMFHELVSHVQALEPDYRDVVLYRFFEDLPPREIAERLDLAVETVKTRLRRALDTLRARLDRDHGSREKWLGSLMPLAFPGAKAMGIGTSTLGAVLMVMQTKMALVGLATLSVLGAGALALTVDISQGARTEVRDPGPVSSPTPAPRDKSGGGVPSDRQSVQQDASYRILGTVRDSRTGSAVSLVPVTFTSRSGKKVHLRSRRSGGFFSQFTVTESEFVVSVPSPWILVSPKTVVLREGGRLDLLVECPYCLLAGTVQIEDGTPVSGVTVKVKGTQFHSRSLEDGKFCIQLPALREDPGEDVQLEIVIDGGSSEALLTTPRYLLVRPDRAYPPHSPRSIVEVSLVPQQELAFRVLRRDGHKIDRLYYALYSRLSTTGQADLSTRYEISDDGFVRFRAHAGDAGAIQFFGKATDYEGRCEPVSFTVPAQVQTVYLTRTRRHKVILVDASGAPVPGAKVEALTANAGSDSIVNWMIRALDYRQQAAWVGRIIPYPFRLSSAITDSKGLAVLDCGIESSCVLLGTARGFTKTVKKIDLRLSATHKLVLMSGASLAGIVTDADVLPSIAQSYGVSSLAIVQSYRANTLGIVWIDDKGRWFPRDGTSIQDGRFEIQGLTPGLGSLWLFTRRPIRRTVGVKLLDVQVRPGEGSRVKVQVGQCQAGSVSGILSLGPAVRGDSMAIRCFTFRSDGLVGYTTSSVTHGNRFRFSGLEPGKVEWAAVFHGPGYESVITIPGKTRILPGQEATPNLVLRHAIVKFQIHPDLKRVAGEKPIILQAKSASGWISFQGHKDLTANVGLGDYQLYIGSTKGEPLGRYQITAASTKVLLTR